MIASLIGNRVTLRELVEADWVDVHSYASLPTVSKYQPWGPNSEEDSLEFVQQVISDGNEIPRSRFVFAVIANNTFIGSGEINIQDFIDRKGEIGYVVHPDYWGLGYATEVAKILIEFGFKQLNLHRISATCDPRNLGSVKVLEKVGMMREGTIRDDFLIHNGWRDSHLYGILEHEWLEKSTSKK
ncbi:GNAT family N-acetyltransferase [Lysinibacillus sp. SGAir0095]|uniref:GNAT family N-acetyltransferase n=1 Tax=Lysinibacillus sp. SGAir0095 TaxID=2070463 RepID=UPI0010CD24B3|nr:GNAT family N-acetyltransferase [Lysinibacillus sp. SGAir0095]QCR31297.1 GNAT family N-acetyltransferase [Lysinibacillus sp. SGAir0095]